MKQSWKIRLAVVAALALTSVMAQSEARSLPAYDTTTAAMESQTFEARGVHEDNTLPAAYKSYTTIMETEIRDNEDGYSLVIPWRLTNGRYTTQEKEDGTKEKGYFFNVAESSIAEPFLISFTKRDNPVEGNVSLEEWNTTWYNKSVTNMTKDEYISLWRANRPDLNGYTLDGDLFDFKGATTARWDSFTRQGEGSTGSTFFDAEFIMKNDPTYRYTLTMMYPSKYQNFMREGTVRTLIPSFNLLKGKYKAKGNLEINSEISFVKPDGFKVVSKANTGAVLTKDHMRIEVGIFPMKQSVPMERGAAYPTMTARQQMADYYVDELVENYDAKIEVYRTLIDNHNTGSLIGGMLNSTTGEGTKFGAYITLTDKGDVVVARILAPSSYDISTQDLLSLVEGVRIQHQGLVQSGAITL
ncbi:hypothetical protein [uncultured Veillonella sp.]|uniref:hypothetical protein n=1 Tax=uncultured Veillonella sp. TaxID=159268 RepID=UPI0026207EF0|nr:hypothetical protein [uncultured Veillonella sp.]